MTNMEKFLKNVAEEILTEHYESFARFLRTYLEMEIPDEDEACYVDHARKIGKMGYGSYCCPSGISCSECMLGWLREEYKED